MSDGAIGARTLLGLGDHGRPVDEGDYLEAEFEEPFRYELSGGRLMVMSPNSEDHIDTAEPWLDRLIVYKTGHRGIVQRVVPEAWVRIGPKDYRIGDLGVYLVGERSARKIPVRVPELMIEVLSLGKESRDRDLVEKRAEYHSVRVLEYVIVDRFRERVHVLTHEVGGYSERILTEAEAYSSPLLPGLAIPLSEVFGG